MQHVLTTVARDAARQSGFITRERAFDGAQFAQLLTFGWLDNPQATMDDLVAMADELGITISAPGLCSRLTDKAADCMQMVLQAAIAQVIAADPLATPVLARFSAILLQDSTIITLPDALADQFQGCGGSCGQVAAALKAQLRIEVRTGKLDGPLLQDGRAHDRAVAFVQRPPVGALQLRDLSFFQLDDLAIDQQDDRHWITRLKPKTAIFIDGERVDLVDFLTAHGATPVDVPVTMGVQQRIPCRLLAIPVPQEVMDQRRRRLYAEARRKGRAVSAERLALCAWTILVTTLEPDQLTMEEALVLLKLRWQIELLFKLWKSHGQVDESRGQRPARILVEIYAKFLGMLIQHWLLLTGCWHAPDRSLPKAAKRVRKAARSLAQAMGSPRRLQAAIRRLVRQLEQTARQTKRVKEPNAYQLLQDPSLLALT
jgi:hypothetical protein